MSESTITVKVELIGESSYQQGNYYEPEFLDGESHCEHETRTWRNRAHCEPDGICFVPGVAIKKSLVSAAKSRSDKYKGQKTYTSMFTAGVIPINNLCLNIKKSDAGKGTVFVPSDGKPGGGKRVVKHFPTFDNWKGSIEFLIIDTRIIEEIFYRTLETAGKLVGIGVWRPEKGGMNGRFRISKLEWIDGRKPVK